MSVRELIILFLVSQENISPQRLYEDSHQQEVEIPLGSLHTTLTRMAEKKLLNHVGMFYSITDTGRDKLQKILEILKVPQLQAEVEKFRVFFDMICHPVFVHEGFKQSNGDQLPGPGKILYANRASVDTFGYSLDELYQMTPLDFESPTHAQKHLPNTIAELENKGQTAFETMFLSKNNQSIFCEVAVKIFLWNGNLRHVTVIHDISKRTKVEEEIKETVERLELVLWGTDLGIWDWNITTNIVHYNDKYAEQLGYQSAKELLPVFNEWKERVHPEDIDLNQQLLINHLHGESPYYESDFRMRTKTNAWVHIKARARVVARSPDGNPLRLMGTHKLIS